MLAVGCQGSALVPSGIGGTSGGVAVTTWCCPCPFHGRERCAAPVAEGVPLCVECRNSCIRGVGEGEAARLSSPLDRQRGGPDAPWHAAKHVALTLLANTRALRKRNAPQSLPCWRASSAQPEQRPEWPHGQARPA
jgi:hypothetical protein